jgi:hypothetical protein
LGILVRTADPPVTPRTAWQEPRKKLGSSKVIESIDLLRPRLTARAGYAEREMKECEAHILRDWPPNALIQKWPPQAI